MKRGRKPLVPVQPDALPEPLRFEVLSHQRARARASEARKTLSEQKQRATVALRAAGYSTRQVAGLLGCTHQRVTQIEACSGKVLE